VLGSGDKICVGGVALCLRLLLGLLLRAALGGCLGDIFLLASLRLLVLPEDGLDRLLTRGELGGDVHQLARAGGSLATQFAHQEIPRVPRAHVRALEVSSEGFDQVVPVGNLRRRQMLQPGSGGVGEEQGEVADNEVVIVRST
jgi:hypothetical protein